jgi:PPOX class probable F420-dependent enzyme
MQQGGGAFASDALVLKKARSSPVARMGTIRPDGSLHLVPIVFAFDDEELVTAVDAKPKRSKALTRLSNIAGDPRVCVLIDHYQDDWNGLWWARLDGEARIVKTGPEFDRAIEALVDKYPQYQQDPPEGPVIRVRIGRVAAWRAGH